MLTPEEIEMFKRMLNDHRIIPNWLACGSDIFKRLQELPEDERKSVLGSVKFYLVENQKPNEVLLGCKHSNTWHPIYDKDGYDELGFNKEGYNRQGFKKW